MKLNLQWVGADTAHAAKIFDLEMQLLSAAAKVGTQQYFDRHGKYSKMTIYDFDHPDLDGLNAKLTTLLLQRPLPPKMIDNSWWTFLGCIGLKLPADIRRLVYQYYVKTQYPPASRLNLYNRPMYNLSVGKKWLHGLTKSSLSSIKTMHVTLVCLVPHCKAPIKSMVYSSSKLAYEKWMDVHLQTIHGISLLTYLNRDVNCLHHNRKTHQRFLAGDMFREDRHSQDVICVDCGHRISATEL